MLGRTNEKSIFIILTIFLIITIAISYFLWESQRRVESANRINQEYNTYYDKTILGTDVASIINKTIDQNEKNKIEKDENNVYLENETNSIKIYLKFLESDDTFLMEAISNRGIESFIKYYSASNFKCTSIEYHEKTKYVKSLTFEQVQ